MTFLVQIDTGQGLTLDLWEHVDAEDMGHAAARVAARWGPGERRVFVTKTTEPLYENGMPMVVHGMVCRVGAKP